MQIGYYTLKVSKFNLRSETYISWASYLISDDQLDVLDYLVDETIINIKEDNNKSDFFNYEKKLRLALYLITTVINYSNKWSNL